MDIKEYMNRSLSDHYDKPITMTFNQNGIYHFKDDDSLYGSIVVDESKGVMLVSELDGNDFNLEYDKSKITKSVKSVIEQQTQEKVVAKSDLVKQQTQEKTVKKDPKTQTPVVKKESGGKKSKQPFELKESVDQDDYKINIIVGKPEGPYKLFPMSKPIAELNKGIVTMRVRTAIAFAEQGEKVLNDLK
jgi:hypothetical protein